MPLQSNDIAKLDHWLNVVPLYQRLNAGKALSLTGENFHEIYPSLPFITKQHIRSGFPLNFVQTQDRFQSLIDQDLIELEKTSGTSEESTPLMLKSGWWTPQELTTLRLNTWIAEKMQQPARRVTLVSPSCSNEISYKGVPSCSDRTIGLTRFVNLSRHPFLWPESALKRMHQEAFEWNPLFLDVDPVYGVLFALYCQRNQLQLPSLQFIVSTYEYLSVVHREIMERVFQVPVYNLFGSTETGHLLMENIHHQMISNEQNAFLEVVDMDDQGIGNLVVSTLENDFMPLLRYQIGDLVQCQKSDQGTTFKLHGRQRDSFIGPQNRRLTVGQIGAIVGEKGDACKVFGNSRIGATETVAQLFG